MEQYHEETLLIITKTYPSPSSKYRETSCIAAINHNGDLRRLFPIPFRLLDGSQQFKRWEWIKARIIKARDDHRPESYKVDLDTIERKSRLGTDQAWAERLQRIEAEILPDFNSLDARRQSTGQSLGFIRPNNYSLEVIKSENPDWTDKEKLKLVQDGLFDTADIKDRIPLRKIPYDFYYRYECQASEGNLKYRHKIVDWEAGALYWNCVNEYGVDWERYFRYRLEEDFKQNKDLILLMGTMHRFPDIWLIVGLIYPPRVHARQQVFLLPVDE